LVAAAGDAPVLRIPEVGASSGGDV
jgi:hypothetical protein